MSLVSGRASIIIITYNGLDYNRQCLDSIYAKTDYPDYEVIVVDNASQDGTPAFLLEYAQNHPNLRVILNSENEGFARANNQGAAAAKGEYLVFLNNDTVVTPGWLDGLLRHLQDPQVGIVGPVTNASSNETRILVDYENLDDLDNFARRRSALYHGKSFDIRVLPFFCVVIRHLVFIDTGLLDERFGLGMFEDDDYAMRLRQKGYRVICAEDVYIHHWGGSSFLKMDSESYWQLFRENRKKFEQKWGQKWKPHVNRQELQPDQIVQLTELVFSLQWSLLQLQGQIKTLNDQVNILKNEIKEIHASRGWKLVQQLWRVRLVLFPQHSRREKFLRKLAGKPLPEQPLVDQGEPDQETETKPQESKHGQLVVGGSEQKLAILAPQFFDFAGENLYLGGAERYLVELARLTRDLGFQPVVYQSGQGDWTREYDGFPVLGLDSAGDGLKLNEKFHTLIPESMPVVYLAFYLAAPRCVERSVGISHGIYWDNLHHKTLETQVNKFQEILHPITNLTKLVSVDTNTINWLRTIQPDLADKSIYIPNFVDPDEFHPVSKAGDDQIVILYPRRLYPPRGFWLVKEIVPEFIKAYPNVEFHFVGQANFQEEIAVQALIKEFPDRVQWRSLGLAEMYRAYQLADISLIPTVHSEGTSLSCLEAMASGNAVITTNVGGLPDLVISGYNGLLIEPTIPALREALHTLCQDALLRQSFSKRAVEVAATFSIQQWRTKWQKVLGEVIKGSISV
jgi:GT2 family glycosyltransferase/glycosyltransferase involved in cell wall biosynthesis